MRERERERRERERERERKRREDAIATKGVLLELWSIIHSTTGRCAFTYKQATMLISGILACLRKEHPCIPRK
jgi:hypothetical protein